MRETRLGPGRCSRLPRYRAAMATALLPKFRDLWYGPFITPRGDGNGGNWTVARASVNITDLVEELDRLTSALRTPADSDGSRDGFSLLAMVHGEPRHDPKFETFAAPDWRDTRLYFQWTASSRVLGAPVVVTITTQELTVSVADTGDPEVAATVREFLSQLERVAKPRHQPGRIAALLGVLVPSAMVALWVWSMMATTPPLAVWMLSGALVTLASMWTWRMVVDEHGSPTDLRSGLAVDMTPREQVLANRMNERRDRQIAIRTALITSPVAAVIGAALLDRLSL